jgi:cobalt/nickel transport system ATP-binding protein
MSHHRLEAKDLHFTYPDGRKAVGGLSFLVHHGDSVGIIGANGAGKSTLLMLLTGLLQADSGEVIVGDVRLTKKTLHMIRERVGMVMQDPEDQLFMPTIYEDVAFGPRSFGLEEYEVEERVKNALDTVGIEHLRDRAPFRLSGGEKRAAAIASALSMLPDILIMDEPSAGLDPKARKRLISLLKSFEHTKIVTSHDLDMILELCSRVIVLKDGVIAADGPAKELLADADLMDSCGLELPLSLQNCNLCGKPK